MGAPVVPAAEPYLAAQLGHENEPTQQPPISRETIGGRVLWYQLKVIQQPERARACGSGPKSSADRRPVDPPPVVELRIFEGPTWEQAQQKDITFVYQANFFLYATLEHARVLARGRLQSGVNPNTPPVLTGMPVSGMAYLDRPSEAGYFLFPDLSVRHEGRYKLVFSLYEETKEACDRTAPSKGEQDPANPYGAGASDVGGGGGSFDYRDEIRSQDFHVFSAKKFPGLSESTNLSKVVADQGCRVRIRRDVRMRRRDGKGSTGGGDYENNNAEDAYARRRRTETPDNSREQYRQRSMSGSVERTPYSAEPGRRPSMPEYAQYPQPQTPTPTSALSHLNFLGGSSGAHYPARPSFAHPPSVPHSPTYPPPPNAYPTQSAYPPPPPYPSERPPSRANAAPVPSPKTENAPHEYARRLSHAPSLPPLQASSNPPPPIPPSTSNAPSLPSLHSLTAEMIARRPSFARGAPGPLDAKHMAPVPSTAGTKRGRDSFSRDDPDTPRRQNGSRDDGEVHDDTEGTPLVYSRAGGYTTSKPAPRMFP